MYGLLLHCFILFDHEMESCRGKELIRVCERHIPKHSKYTKSNRMWFLLLGDSCSFKKMKEQERKTKQNKTGEPHM